MTERDRSWIHVSFHFVSFRFIFCLHVVFQTNVAKDKQEFSPCSILCRVLLRDAVRCSVFAQRRTI